MVSQLFTKMPGGQVEIKARRQLPDEATFEAFIEELQNQLLALKEATPEGVVADLDVSQNPLSLEQVETLFATLTLGGIKVLRMRFFGCPAMNDEAIQHLSTYFLNELTSETAPLELHLSDCALQNDGFLSLMNAIEEKELYPTTVQPGRAVPLYLRLENNYIEEAVMQEKVDAGIMRKYRKGNRYPPGGDVKVNLISKSDTNFSQKVGVPPAPEDAPPPKDVFDNKTANKGWDNGKGGGNWRQAQGPPNQSWNSARPQWRPQVPRPQWQPRPQAVQPRMALGGSRPPFNAGGGPRNPSAVRPQVIQAFRQPATPVRPMSGGWQPQKAGAWPRGSAGTAVDRSRTPAGRATPYTPAGGPPKTSGGLPHPWEEQWSDEYQIPYYWNAETGDSLWERPTA